MGTTSNRVCIECNDELPEMSSDQPKTLCYQLTDMISLSLSSDSGNTEMLNLSLCSRARFARWLMPVVATFKTDWFRVISDITRTGILLHEIARELDVSKSAIIGWKQGAAPNHHTGEALIDFWCYVTAPAVRAAGEVTSRRFVYAWRTKRI